jgi:dynactin-5
MASAFLEPIPINPKEYAFTDSGNIISRSAKIYGPQNIVINGRSVVEKKCVIRGDLRRLIATTATVKDDKGTVTTGQTAVAAASLAGSATAVMAGRYLSLGESTILRPPGKLYKGYV